MKKYKSKSNAKKLIFVLTILFIMININFFNTVYAIEFNAENYKPDSTDQVSDAGKLQDIGNTIIGVIRTVGSLMSVVVLIIIGIKYMMGSAEERAEYKKTMTPYVIGAILLFGITNLLAIVADLTKGVFEG